MPPVVWDLLVRTVFPTMKDAKKAVLNTVIHKGESYRVNLAQKVIRVAVCRGKACPLRIRLTERKSSQMVEMTRSVKYICSPDAHRNWRPAASKQVLHCKIVADNCRITP